MAKEKEPYKPFTITQGNDDQFYWHIKSKNGNITADGSEGYKTYRGAIKGFLATKKLINSVDITLVK